MSVASILAVYNGQEPDLCFGSAPGPGGVNSVGVGAGLAQTGSAANPVVSLGMSAVGDLLVGTGVANSGAVLGKGANGEFLRVNLAGTGLEYAAVAPGGVDSVSAVAGNVGLVLTTAPGSPADPQIGLAFSAKADIPVGTALSTGVMVSAPLPLTSGLVLQTDVAEASGVKWAPAAGPTGVITTNAPLKDSFSAGNNLISIDFTTAQGEIPYGTGTAETGALLAPPTGAGAVGKVLTYNGIVQGQPALGWATPVTPVGGDTIILHSNAASGNLVPVPTDQNTSLILVAGEIQAAWDKLALNLPNIVAQNYAPELLIKSNANTGSKEFLAIGCDGGPNGRVVELYDMDTGPAPVKLGIFSFVNASGSPDADAQLCCYCNGDDPYGGANFFVGTSIVDNILIGGKFNRYNDAIGSAANTFGFCQLTNVATAPKIEYIFQSGQETIFGFTNSNDPVNDTTTTIYTIAGFPAGALSGLGTIPPVDGPQTPLQYPGVLIGGTFDTIHQQDNTGAPDDVQGFGGLAIMYAQPASTIEVLLPGPCKEYGIWVSKFVESVTTTCLIAVRKIVWQAGYNEFCMCGSDFSVLAFNNNGSGTQLFLSLANPNSAGFCLYSAGATAQLSGASVWDQNDNPSGNQPTFNTNNTYDIGVSSQLAGHIILNGTGGVAFVDLTNAAAWVWTASVPQGTNIEGQLNSILINHAAVTPGPITITGDWVLGVENTGASPAQVVGYITTAGGAVVTNLVPDPTGVTASVQDGVYSAYGLQPATNSLLISGTGASGAGSVYQYDASTHPSIEFTTTPPMFWKEPAGTGGLTKATFSTAYNSQSYIASADKAFWIQVGQQGANLAYS